MTCARCNDTRRVTEPGADPCATPEEVWCPDCANPPPPFVPDKTGLYWVSERGAKMWKPALVIISKARPAASSIMLIGSDLLRPIGDYEFGPKIERPAELRAPANTPIPGIPMASGETLDRMGELNAVTRADGEPDADFRARILQTFRDREAQARRDFFAHLGPGPFAPPPPETRAEWEALYKDELGNPL